MKASNKILRLVKTYITSYGFLRFRCPLVIKTLLVAILENNSSTSDRQNLQNPFQFLIRKTI